MAEAAFTQGHVLQVGIQCKLASSLSACRSAGIDFIPIVAEALGGLAEDTITTIKAIGQAIANRTNITEQAPTTKHLFGRLTIALWRGNVNLWLHRYPTLPPSLDGIDYIHFLFLFIYLFISFIIVTYLPADFEFIFVSLKKNSLLPFSNSEFPGCLNIGGHCVSALYPINKTKI